MPPNTESITPSGWSIARQAYALTRYDAHSGTSTAATRIARIRRGATRAMKNANGTAMTMQRIVTSAAMSSVRPMIFRYVGENSSLKFSVVKVVTTLLVKGSVVKNAVAKIIASAPR